MTTKPENLGISTLGIGGIVSGVSGLVSAFSEIFGGKSPKQEELQNLLDNLYKNEEWVKSTPFTKDELFSQIYPQLQKLERGAADVVAGRLGAVIGEVGSEVGGGENFADMYIQNLAPIIAGGEVKSAEHLQGLVELFSKMSDSAKQRFLKLSGLEGQVVSGMESTNPFQRAFISFLQGADIGATAFGNISGAKYLAEKEFK